MIPELISYYLQYRLNCVNRNVCSLHCFEYSGKSFKRLHFVTSTAEARLTLNKHFTKILKASRALESDSHV